MINRLTCVALAVAIVSAPASLRGQGEAPLPRPVVPVSLGMLARQPETFLGQDVTLTGQVGERLSITAFTIDSKPGSTVPRVLVIAPRLNQPLAPGSYVTVIGALQRFDPEKPSPAPSKLPTNAAEPWIGKLVVLATAVIENKSMVDLASLIAPTKSPEEKAFSELMQKVVALNGDLRKGMTEADPALIAKTTPAVKSAFTEFAAFWKKRGAGDAVQFSQSALMATTAVERAAASGKWDIVKTEMGTLSRQCQSCHTAHRASTPDGGYFIKTAVN